MTSPLELFCDRGLGHHKVPDRLRQVHSAVIVHDDVFETAEEWAEAFVAALPKILRTVAKNPSGGYIMGVNRNGKLRHLFPETPVAG